MSISSLALSDAGNYYVSNYNSAGSSNSAAAAVTVLATPTVPIPVSGLVMHHKFDASLIDSTGRGNDGTGKHTEIVNTLLLGEYCIATSRCAASICFSG